MIKTESTVIKNLSIKELVNRAQIAQEKYELFKQNEVDAIVRDIGKFVYDNAEELAKMAVDETEMGSIEDKTLKNKSKARVIWNNLKDKKSRGVIGEDTESHLVYVAKPMGVVAAVTPVTNPIVTPMCNGMFALKTGNAVIFAAHPKAQKCAEYLTKEFMKIVKYVRPELKLTGHFRKRDTTWNIQFREGYIVTTDDFRKNGGWFI